jgi:hypothetical protein
MRTQRQCGDIAERGLDVRWSTCKAISAFGITRRMGDTERR